MNKYYIFSMNEIVLKQKDNQIFLHDNMIANLQQVENSNFLAYSNTKGLNNLCYVDLNTANMSNLFKITKLNEDHFVEIISTALEQKSLFSIDDFKIAFYLDRIDIFYKTEVLSYYYKYEKNNYVIKDKKALYIFNSKCFLEFNIKNNSFNLIEPKKFEKKDNYIEVLCNIPKVNNYFVLYKINISNSFVTKKIYKNGNFNIQEYSLPFIAFNLIKNNVSEAKKLLSPTINFEDLCAYFSKYNRLIEIDGKYYLCGENIEPIKFKIENNIFVDVD